MKIHEKQVETLEQAFEEQNEYLQENERFTFKIVEVFLAGYVLEVHEEKKENLINILDEYYNSFKQEIKRLEEIE
ncbi:hypothetical protein [Fusobacterium ulcerans]|uniref:hypothetical protein n=1 Tax=Fusobacterium ulcerans TaxID=861 RepID=UPI00241D3B30|nr:hypothetical protein [Fusobacterium ulcerans]